MANKNVRELNDESLVDMKFMTNDAGFTAKFFYSQIKSGILTPPTKFGRSSRWKYKDYKSWKMSYFDKNIADNHAK